MRSRWRVGVVLTLVSLVGALPAVANDEAVSQARTAALAWLAQLDAREYGETWKAAGELLQGAVTQKEWVAKVGATLGPMGSVTSREAKSSEYATSLPGAPAGEYVVLKFDLVFENTQKAVETVILGKEKDGLWRVSGWNIL